MIVDPRETAYQNISKLLTGAVVPRPIAFVSTVSLAGVLNLAPFSYFTVVSANPPVICFCPTRRAGPVPFKDTLSNILATGEFVVNIVSEEIARQMNICAAEFPPRSR